MRRFSAFLVIALSLLIVVVIHIGLVYHGAGGNAPFGSVEVLVPKGASFEQIKTLLADRGVLEQPGMFRWAAYLTRRERSIKTGRYIFRRGEPVAVILRRLVDGDVDYMKVVIPEGLMLKEIAAVLERAAGLDSVLFMDAVTDGALAGNLGVRSPTIEGYLFPDTYLFAWPLEAQTAIEGMVGRFYEVFDGDLRSRADSLGLSENEAVTLASIIQGEAVLDSEMPRISAVYHNRLRMGWRLQADPTVAYALGGVRRELYFKDLEVDSPYNTYRISGLPPGPICSPGKAALTAAVSPLTGCRDMYFVADGSGGHRFSRTQAEHLRAVRLIKSGGLPIDDDDNGDNFIER